MTDRDDFTSRAEKGDRVDFFWKSTLSLFATPGTRPEGPSRAHATAVERYRSFRSVSRREALARR